jgi:phage-related protein
MRLFGSFVSYSDECSKESILAQFDKVYRNIAIMVKAVPRTEVLLFADEGCCPFLIWLASLPQAARLKCIIRIERLEELGHELRRPEADYLRDDIYELRATTNGIHYRILYFFHQQKAVISHGLRKEKEVPATDISKAKANKVKFATDPTQHTHEE